MWDKILEYVEFTSDLEKLKQSYINDPLFGCGWKCKTNPNINVLHQLHFTYKYYKNEDYELENIKIPLRIYDWELVIGDTRDEDHRKWIFFEI